MERKYRWALIIWLSILMSGTTGWNRALAASIGVGGVGAPLQTKLADTLPEKRVLFFTKHESLTYYDNSTLAERSETLADTHFRVAMGLTDDVMLTLSTSAAHRSGNVGNDVKTIRGLGETIGLFQWRVKNGKSEGKDPTSQISVAFLFGIKTPTGESRKKLSNGDLYPMPMQLGSGSVDYSFGFVTSGDYDYFDFSLSSLYTVNDQDDGYKFGNRLELSTRLSLNLIDQPKETLSGLSLIGELTYFNKDKDIKKNELQNATGGKSFYLSTGMNIVFTEKFSLALLVQMPFYQHKNNSELQQNEAYRWMLMGGFLL